MPQCCLASSMIAWNIYHRNFKPNITTAELSKAIQRSVLVIGVAATVLALRFKSVYLLWVLCSDFVYCMLFPQLLMALFDKKANKIGAAAGMLVSFVLRFGGGEPTLHLPRLLPYPMIEDGVVLFPFRTLAMVMGVITIFCHFALDAKNESADCFGLKKAIFVRHFPCFVTYFRFRKKNTTKIPDSMFYLE